MPVALDKATRIVQTLLIAGKEYVGIMHLHKDISKEDLINGINKFIGKIMQLPPRKSAVKRQIREREVYYFKILEIEDKDVLFKIGCQAGVYIRKIISDLGNKLGVGAHMQQLVRTKAGPFKIENSFTLHDLNDAYSMYKEENNEKEIRKIILPFENAVDHLNKIWVNDKTVNNLCHGSDLYGPGVEKLNRNINSNELVAVMTLKDELICLGETQLNTKDIIEKEKGLVLKTKKVFMERNTYNYSAS